MDDAMEILNHWRKHPPTHRILASVHNVKPQLTVEEQWAQGAMGPADFLGWVKSTSGKKAGPNG
jgi:hypothetical protein